MCGRIDPPGHPHRRAAPRGRTRERANARTCEHTPPRHTPFHTPFRGPFGGTHSRARDATIFAPRVEFSHERANDGSRVGFRRHIIPSWWDGASYFFQIYFISTLHELRNFLFLHCKYCKIHQSNRINMPAAVTQIRWVVPMEGDRPTTCDMRHATCSRSI